MKEQLKKHKTKKETQKEQDTTAPNKGLNLVY